MVLLIYQYYCFFLGFTELVFAIPIKSLMLHRYTLLLYSVTRIEGGIKSILTF